MPGSAGLWFARYNTIKINSESIENIPFIPLIQIVILRDGKDINEI